MTRANLSRMSSALAISISALILCDSQLWAQTLDQRMPVSVAARIAAARLAGQAVSSPMAEATITPTEAQGTFITFDAPGAGDTGFDPGTFSVSINAAGEILGSTRAASGVTGFLRSSQGTFTTFNVPGATQYLSPFFGNGPFGSSLNPSGEATGTYIDADGTSHGFVRDPRGVIKTFDAPGADITPGDQAGTTPFSINPAGEVTGYYLDANFIWHGFLRDKKGNVTDFDAPGAIVCPFGTLAQGINAGGEITGYFLDSDCNQRGFRRERNGAFTVFDVPGLIFPVSLTINNAGSIAGTATDAATFSGRFFLRDNRGFFTIFDIPNVSHLYPSMQINPAGVIVGPWLDGNFVGHGFRRATDGTITTIDVPGALSTFALSINPAGVITGFYFDSNLVAHGFLFQPQ